MSDDKNELRTDNPENDSNFTVPVIDPRTDIEVPEADPERFLQPEELPDTGSVFAPGGSGSTPLAKRGSVEGNEGTFLFIQGYPLFLPNDIAQGLAQFILTK